MAADFVKVAATILAGAADQAVPHGLDQAPDWCFIVEKNELEGPKKALYAQCFTSVGVAIGTIVLTDVLLAVAAAYTVDGVHYAAAPADPFWDLTGFDVTNGMYNVCLLCIDNLGAMQIGAGVEAAALADVVLPDTPADSCVVATVEVHPTGAGNFVGGTTALDDVGVVPNAVYVNRSGHPDLFGEITLGSVADATNVYVDNSMQSARDIEVIAAWFHSIIV